MKKIFIIIIVFYTFLVSCQDWLEESPKAVAAETFYNTTGEADAAVLASLYKLRSFFSAANWLTLYPSFMISFADYSYGRGSWEANSDYVGLNTQNVQRSDEMWTYLYQAVRDCNIAIDRLPLASDMNENQINSYLGELRFIRGFTYYHLVRLYGAVPLRTEMNMQEWDMERSSVNSIYTFIIEDLEFAQTHCPQTERIAGTPSRMAAKSLLAQVYMELKDYTKAMNLLKEVVDSKRYSLIPVSNSREFEKIFGADANNTTEEVFYMKMNHLLGWNYVQMAAHPGALINGRPMLSTGAGFYGHYTRPDNPVIAGWDDNDLRKEYNLLPFDIGMGFDTYLLVKFYDPDAPDGYSASNDYPLIRYTDVMMLYAEAITMANGAPNDVAMEQINMIHRRGYGYDPNVASVVDFRLEDYATQELFINLIVKEHAYEEFNETKRWFFLIRLGIAAKVIKEVKGIDIAEKHYLFPIPAAEFTYNKALDPVRDQNPGY